MREIGGDRGELACARSAESDASLHARELATRAVVRRRAVAPERGHERGSGREGQGERVREREGMRGGAHYGIAA